MKKTSIILGALALTFAVGAVKGYEAILHARHDLVTLRVHNAPLRSVLARIQRQTRERIVADQSLGGAITLQVKKAPLRQVLREIARQAGALSRLNLAIGKSGRSLALLEAGLREGKTLEQAGWTNLTAGAPAGDRAAEGPESLAEPPREGLDGGGARFRVRRGAPGGPLRIEEDKGGTENTRATLVATTPEGQSLTIDLSPQRLVMESSLAAALPPGERGEANPANAARLAQQSRAQWRPVYGLEAVPFPPDEMPPLDLPEWSSEDDPAIRQRLPNPGNIEADVRRRRFEQLTRTTPEQRARFAAQHVPGTRFEVDVEQP